MYKRTGALGDTPKVTDIDVSGNSASFTAFLDTSGGYTTGDNPSMEQVLNLANYKTRWITSGGHPARLALGKTGFWERAEEKMEDTFNKTMRQFFD